MNSKSLKANRAAQFVPFDSLKGLQEELRAREKKLMRCEMKELSEEDAMHLSERMLQIEKGMNIQVLYYNGARYEVVEGAVTEKNMSMRYIAIDGKKIPFSVIRELKDIG